MHGIALSLNNSIIGAETIFFNDVRNWKNIQYGIIITDKDQPKRKGQIEVQFRFRGGKLSKVWSEFTIKSGRKHCFWNMWRGWITVLNTVKLTESTPYYLTVKGGGLFVAVIH